MGTSRKKEKYLSQNSRNEYPRGRYPGVMRFHENSFSEMRASAIFIFSSKLGSSNKLVRQIDKGNG